MKNNKFIKSTIILIIGSGITRLMGFIIKILYTRSIGTYGINLYSLVMPTYSLIVTIASFGMPLAISKLVSQDKYLSKDIMMQGLYILIFINIIFMLLIICFSSFIANTLLNAPQTKVLIIGLALAMPNMGLASIFKGYFYGKQRMLPNSISNIIEQSIRIIFIIYFLPYFISKSIIIGVLSFILINIVTEGASIITFLFLIPKNNNIKLSDFKYNPCITNQLLSSSIPLITGKIIGSIGYFLEPILLSNTLIYIGYDSNFFVSQYGIYNSYAMSLLLMPTFFITALSQAIIPEISKHYYKNNYKMVRRRIKNTLKYSLIFGFIVVLFTFIKGDYLLNFVYNTSLSLNYLKVLCIFFTLYYLEAPLSAILQALGYPKYVMKITTIGVFIKLLFMFLLTLFHIGIYGLIIAEAINIIFVVLFLYLKVKRIIKKGS